MLGEMLKEMMLPRYHLKIIDGGWSNEAHQFLSLSITESVKILRMVSGKAVFFWCFVNAKQHPFLTCSLPSGRLTSRVRFALEILREGTSWGSGIRTVYKLHDNYGTIQRWGARLRGKFEAVSSSTKSYIWRELFAARSSELAMGENQLLSH